MKRRTDRIIAISALGAVAVVPTAVLAVVKTGGGSGPEAGTMPPAAAMADREAAGEGPGAGTLTPSGGAVPGAGTGGGPGTAAGSGAGPSGTGSGAGGTGGGSAAAKAVLPDEQPKPSPDLRAFVRKTDVKLALGTAGDYTHATETAQFTLYPKFALNATGVTTTVKDGQSSEVTEKVIVQDGVLKGYDGQEWTQSKLTQEQLTRLQTGSDPRQFTYLMASLPDLFAEGPDAQGRTHFLADSAMGDLYGLLPQNVAEQVGRVIPGDTGVAVDLWANAQARPTWIGLKAQATGGALDGSMTFGSYR
ncbi:hypothetical protein [Actinomadura sp. WMMB 499]|uniref:hypothetical protein n=1 Tax=Actinomadura sp. WMMB 499 TaxID=1219491 RepID=UPI0012491C97|nr:hypothetical protein [Actinomadura sp. WMMB 499]QFG23864.1 hypothetical protein F7P10_24840 [Actinomadura sp. WMMB 499]